MDDLFSITGDGSTPSPVVVVTHPGPPRGKGRPRFRYVQPKGRAYGFVTTYTDAETKAYEDALRWRGKAAWGSRPLIDQAFAVRLFAMLPIPASWSIKKRDAALSGQIYPTVKPDDDNILKFLDAFNGVIWTDDAKRVRSLVVKEYAERPGLIVEVYTLP